MRRPLSSFRQLDVKRAIEAAKAAGLEVDRVEIDPKTEKISVVARKAEGGEHVTTVEQSEPNPFDGLDLVPTPRRSRKKCPSRST